MTLQSLSGTATNVTLGSHVGYAPTAQYGPMAVKLQLVTFRLNGRPVRIKIHESASITEGDHLIAAGDEKQGTLEALAVKNLPPAPFTTIHTSSPSTEESPPSSSPSR